MIPLWVCEDCEILLGMNIKHNGNMLTCVNCSCNYKIDEVPFVDLDHVKKLKIAMEAIIPSGILEYIHYRWLSNTTVGIQIDYDEQEFLSLLDFDFYDHIEDNLSDELDLFITIEFE